MAAASRKAAFFSIGIIFLAIAVALFLLNNPDRNSDTGGGKTRQAGESAEPIDTGTARPPGDGEGGERGAGELSADGTQLTSPPPADDGAETEKAEASGQVVIRILRADGEEPLANEEFNLRLEGPTKTRNLLLRTDDEGIAHARGLAEGSYPSLLRHPGFLPDRRILEVPAARTASELEVITILLEKGEQITGKVTNLRGQGIKGARITLAAATADGPQRRQASSGADGSFALDALTDGAWVLTVFHLEYRSGGPLKVKIPSSDEVTVRLVAARGINITIQNPDTTACVGARIATRIIDAPAGAITVAPTRSGSGGLAVLKNLPADPGARLLVTATDARYPRLQKNVTVDELESGSFVLRFAPARSIGGMVVDSNGNPVADARISLEGPLKLFLRSAANGSFQFKKIPPGEYRLQAAAAARGVSKRRLADTEEESLPGLELVLEPGVGAISGRVEDGDGQPLRLVPLRLTAEGFSIESVSSPAGDFSFLELPQASYTLRAGDSKRGQARREGLAPGSRDVRLVIEKPGSLRGVLESGGPARGFSLRLVERPGDKARGLRTRTWHFTSQVARFHLRDLPPGFYDLLLLREGEVAGRIERVSIRAGEETGPVSISASE